MQLADMVLVMCILMSAYFIRGITGFGSALISVPLLALSQPLQFAIPLVLALDFTASVVLGSTNSKKANWSEIKILLPAGMVGASIGAFALLRLPTEPVLVALGTFTMFFGFRNIFGLQPAGRLSRTWAIPAGLAGGGAGALFGAGSPPYIIYLTRRLLDKSEVRATFSWLIAIDGGFRLGLFLIAGLLFEPKLQMAYALGLMPMALGLYMGNKVHMDITSEGMLKVVGTLLVLSGLLLCLKVAT
ncbi:MAG TPA: sulfite exporter TauE/SafE family protein [Burkholderiales bacterium]|nr:sulfite exporter TauE/SafE family protein [Burkholderiales bacterium]